MRCRACKTRCDPNHSFCRRCGSAVFVDEATSAADTLRAVSAQTLSPDGPAASRVNFPQPAPRRRQARPERTSVPRVPRATAEAAPSVVAAIGSLIRMALFFGLLYAVISLWSVQEVRDLVVSLVRGERPELQPLLIRLTDWLAL